MQLNLPRFIVNGNRSSVVLRLGHVVGMNELSENLDRISTGKAHGCSGEAEKFGVWERFAKITRVSLQESVLTSMGLVSYHDDVFASGEHWMLSLDRLELAIWPKFPL